MIGKKENIIYPICGSSNGAKYLFGMPAYDDELQEKLQGNPNKVVDERCKAAGF